MTTDPRQPESGFTVRSTESIHTVDFLRAAYTAGDDTAGISVNPIPLGDRLSGWVAATGQSVLNSDARLDLDDDARDRSPLRRGAPAISRPLRC